MKRFGNDYGGYWLPEDALDRFSVVYSFGLGEDASFDLAVAENFGCRVKIFDPTPRAIAFFDSNLLGIDNFEFHDIALWSDDIPVRFYPPRDPAHVSHSIINLQNTSCYLNVNGMRMVSIMEQLNDYRVDLLKMDIEGAEIEVLSDIIRSFIRPRIICVEFHAAHNVESQVQLLTMNGYSVYHSEKNNFTFLYK